MTRERDDSGRRGVLASLNRFVVASFARFAIVFLFFLLLLLLFFFVLPLLSLQILQRIIAKNIKETSIDFEIVVLFDSISAVMTSADIDIGAKFVLQL